MTLKMIQTAVILVVLVFTTSQAKEWDRYEYPNPRQNPDKCGHNRVSYICDPDKVLDDSQAGMLDNEIELVMNYTKCPCATYACEKGTRGYKIGVAVVDKIMKDKDRKNQDEERMDVVDKNLEESLKFSYYLLSEWNLGECAEDLIVFYSVQDHVVYTSTNDITKKKLSNYMVGEISMAHRKELQDGNIYNGLKSMILDYKKVLMDQYERKSSSPTGPKYAAVVGSESTYVIPCFTTVVLVALGTCFLH